MCCLPAQMVQARSAVPKMSRLARPLSLKPYESDRRFIKNELGADDILLAFLEDEYHPDALSIMAVFEKRMFTHTEKFPLRPNWMARAVANLRFSRERA
jgi:hypothetical protein